EKFINTGGGINNNLLDDIRKLQQDFYNQTGLTSKVIDGSADEKEMMNYYNRTVDPLITAVLEEFNRKFITNTAHTQGHIIKAYRDPFKLVPVEQLAQIVDTFTRNAVFTPNESREIVGKQPHPDPLADKLYNRNIADANQAGGTATIGQTSDGQPAPTEEVQPAGAVPEVPVDESVAT
ncbi:phage portal family protein, partial [Herbiconiux daphne]